MHALSETGEEGMSVSRKIVEALAVKAGRTMVEDVRVGQRYTAVMLEKGRTGVAFTFQEKMERGCSFFEGLHPLSGRPASHLLALLDSNNMVEAAVGLATANALSNSPAEGILEGDALEYLHVGPEDTVGMVGYFGPVLPRLKRKTSSILIFEQIKAREGDLLTEEDAYRLLPQCQVAMVTSTSILNHTVDRLLEAAGRCREVALLGASTPLLKEVFADTPVTLLAGIIVTRPEEILRTVSEGGGVRFFKGNVKKMNLHLSRSAV